MAQRYTYLAKIKVLGWTYALQQVTSCTVSTTISIENKVNVWKRRRVAENEITMYEFLP